MGAGCAYAKPALPFSPGPRMGPLPSEVPPSQERRSALPPRDTQADSSADGISRSQVLGGPLLPS